MIEDFMAGALQGKKICVVSDRDIFRDGRLRKKLQSYKSAGAEVTVIGFCENSERDSLARNLPYHIVLVQRHKPFVEPFLGRANVLRPIRVFVNLTYTKAKLKAYNFFVGRPRNLFYSRRQVEAVALSDFDFVEASDVFSLKTAAKIAAAKGAHLMFDCYEYFPQYFSDTSIQRECDRVIAEFLPHVHHAFTVSPLFAEALSKKYRKPFSVVLNSPPEVALDPEPIHAPVRLLLQCAFREVSSDYLMVEAMKFLPENVVLTLQGNIADSEYKKKLEQIIKEGHLENRVRFTGDFNSFEATHLAHGHDIGVATYKPSTISKDCTLSNRIFTYMNAGLACALSDTRAHREMPNYESFGILLDLSSPESIALCLKSLIDDPERVMRMKEQAKKEFSQYAWQRQEEILLSLYAS